MPDNMEDEDEDDSEELSFWDECARVAKKNPAPQRGGAAPLGPSGRAPAAGTTSSKKKVNKEEVRYVLVSCPDPFRKIEKGSGNSAIQRFVPRGLYSACQSDCRIQLRHVNRFVYAQVGVVPFDKPLSDHV